MKANIYELHGGYALMSDKLQLVAPEVHHDKLKLVGHFGALELRRLAR